MRIKLRTLVPVVVFVAITGLLATAVGATMARLRFEPSVTYDAIFVDASGIKTGADVRAAGVPVGSVKAIEASGRDVRIRFTVDKKIPVTSTAHARIRYANLTGDRYIDLSDLTTGTALRAGGTIPLSRTQPALDIDEFFAGFDPLMQALDPNEVNQLTSNIIAVTQGQAGAVEELLAHVASFTQTLGNRDQLIGSLIDDLGTALTAVDKHQKQFDDLVTGLSHLTHGLAQQRRSIGSSLGAIDTLALDTQRTLRDVRPGLQANVQQLGQVSARINDNLPYLNQVLGLVKPVFERFGRGGAYGSFFNFYLCGVRLQLTPADGVKYYTPFVNSDQPRCQFPEDR